MKAPSQCDNFNQKNTLSISRINPSKFGGRLKFKPDAEFEQEGTFCKGLETMKLLSGILEMLPAIDRKTLTPFLERLKIIYSAMDKKYQEAADYYNFYCTGCDDNCCFTRFYHHTLLEYFYIMEGYNTLADETQVEVKQRALEVYRKIRDADKKGNPVRLMCPLNVNSLCLIYAFRPMICRLHGIPHVLQRPGQGVIYAPGCEVFNQQCRKKEPFKFDRTPFYMEMAELEKELKQAVGMTQKIKMTVAQMLTTF